MAVNAIGGYAAIKEAVSGFNDLNAGDDGKDLNKVFIATGNVTPFMTYHRALTLAAGKLALTYTIRVAIESYGSKGYWYARQGHI
jgi:hypothetical protein